METANQKNQKNHPDLFSKQTEPPKTENLPRQRKSRQIKDRHHHRQSS